MYTIGIDFGTESGRGVVDRHDGREVATMLHGLPERCFLR